MNEEETVLGQATPSQGTHLFAGGFWRIAAAAIAAPRLLTAAIHSP